MRADTVPHHIFLAFVGGLFWYNARNAEKHTILEIHLKDVAMLDVVLENGRVVSCNLTGFTVFCNTNKIECATGMILIPNSCHGAVDYVLESPALVEASKKKVPATSIQPIASTG